LLNTLGQHKGPIFALKWNNESNTDTQADNQTDEEDATESTNGEDAEDNKEDKTTKKVKESIDKTVYKDPDAANVRSVLNSVEGLRTFVLKTTHDAPPDDPDNEINDKEEEVLEVNFYAVSSAFINELHELFLVQNIENDRKTTDAFQIITTGTGDNWCFSEIVRCFPTMPGVLEFSHPYRPITQFANPHYASYTLITLFEQRMYHLYCRDVQRCIIL